MGGEGKGIIPLLAQTTRGIATCPWAVVLLISNLGFLQMLVPKMQKQCGHWRLAHANGLCCMFYLAKKQSSWHSATYSAMFTK